MKARIIVQLEISRAVLETADHDAIDNVRKLAKAFERTASFAGFDASIRVEVEPEARLSSVEIVDSPNHRPTAIDSLAARDFERINRRAVTLPAPVPELVEARIDRDFERLFGGPVDAAALKYDPSLFESLDEDDPDR